jgi:hypothetical protein
MGQTLEQSGEACYRPSGRVAWAEFSALALAGLAVSAGMAYVLSLLIRRAPENFVMTLTNALPVLVMIVLAVYFGRCRNRELALTLAGTLMVTYYLGAWAMAYWLDVGQAGAGLRAAIRQTTGLPTPLGYFVVRCDPSLGSEPRTGVTAFIMSLHVAECALVVAAGLFAARWFTGRVFYESYGRWASSWTFGFDRRDLERVIAALAARDWAALAAVEKMTVTRDQRRRGILIFRIECLSRAGDQEVYVTIEGPRLWRMGWALMYIPLAHRLTRRWVRQRCVGPDEARRLSAVLPGFEIAPLPRSGTETPQAVGAESLGYWRGEARAGDSGGLLSVVREAGYVGTTLVGRGEDFRAAASAASWAMTMGAVHVDVESIGASLCMPAEAAPLGTLKSLSWIELASVGGFLAFSLVGFLLSWIASPVLAAGHELIAAVCFGLSMVMMGLSAVAVIFSAIGFGPLQRWLLRRHFARRGGSIVGGGEIAGRHELIRIEDPATFHISKLTPEDWGIAVLDGARGRILIEGVSHRYVILAQDVIEVTALKATTASARVTYRVGEVTLGVVINRHSTWALWLGAVATIPILGLPVRPWGQRPARTWARRLGAALRTPVKIG